MRGSVLVLLCCCCCLTACPPSKHHPQASTNLSNTPPAAPNPDTVITKGALPAGWPDFLQQYPGSEIVEGRSGHNNGAPVLTAIMQTPDTPDKIMDFYGKQLIGRNFAIVSSSQVSSETTTVYRRESQSLSLVTRRGKEEATTRIELTLVGTYEESRPAAADSSAADKDTKSPPQKDQSGGAPENPLTPRYPGATAETPIRDGAKSQLRMRTADKMEQVMEYYEKFYADKGFRATGRFNLGNQLAQSFQSGDGTISINVGNSTMGDVDKQDQPTLIILVFDPTVTGKGK